MTEIPFSSIPIADQNEKNKKTTLQIPVLLPWQLHSGNHMGLKGYDQKSKGGCSF
jgi:hypothetical protein